jgi:DNA (cytosine-5)-methyltransferase 1
MRILNLYAGLGGNRKCWDGHEVTAIESDPKIAAVYQKLYPEDTVIVGDAHMTLRVCQHNFDFVWSSPPCQTHSRMVKATRHQNKRYPNMALYEEILFLQHFCKGKYVVENVVPYYEPLIPAHQVGRHLFWSNFQITATDVPRPKGFINSTNLAGRAALQDWLGIHFDEVLYYAGNHCPAQVLRNAVHPELGRQILEDATRDAVGAS